MRAKNESFCLQVVFVWLIEKTVRSMIDAFKYPLSLEGAKISEFSINLATILIRDVALVGL